jgi:hypothetical protein
LIGMHSYRRFFWYRVLQAKLNSQMEFERWDG